MPQILLKKSHGEQPQSRFDINRDSWLYQVFSNVFVPGVALGQDLLGRATPIPFGTGAAAPGFGAISRGRVLTEDGGDTSEHTAAGCTGSASYPLVMAACGYFSSSADAWQFAQMKRSGTGGGDTCQMGLASSTTVQYVLRHNFGSTSTLTITTGSGSNSGLLITMVAVSRSATDHRFFANGLSTSGSTDVGAVPGTFDKLSIGGSKLNGAVLWVPYGLGRRAPTDDEALSLTLNPNLFWELFEDEHDISFFPASVAAGSVFNPLSGRGGAAAQPLRTWQ